MSLWQRFLAYGLLGWCAEIVWTALYDTIAGTGRPPGDAVGRVPLTRAERLRLSGRTYLWMLPLYGSAALLFEPAHDALASSAWPLRGLAYTVGIFAVEALSGGLLRLITGRCPWDYSYARLSALGGTIRLDYGPVWFVFGLMLERAHDLFRGIQLPP